MNDNELKLFKEFALIDPDDDERDQVISSLYYPAAYDYFESAGIAGFGARSRLGIFALTAYFLDHPEAIEAPDPDIFPRGVRNVINQLKNEPFPITR